MGWAPEVLAIAADLAVLSGRAISVENPLCRLERWMQEQNEASSVMTATVVEPMGSKRLVQRLFMDWQRLNERLSGR
jgi:hypothetical protein